MSTTIKVAYIERSNSVASEVSVESDQLSKEEVSLMAKKLALEAQQEAVSMTMDMQRRK